MLQKSYDLRKYLYLHTISQGIPTCQIHNLEISSFQEMCWRHNVLTLMTKWAIKGKCFLSQPVPLKMQKKK